MPTASESILGGVKIDGTTITISDGVISASAGGTTETVLYEGTVAGLTETTLSQSVANFDELYIEIGRMGANNSWCFATETMKTDAIIANDFTSYPTFEIFNTSVVANGSDIRFKSLTSFTAGTNATLNHTVKIVGINHTGGNA